MSLRLTGLYLLAGQLIGILLTYGFAKPEKGFWLFHACLACIGITLIIVFNIKYWTRKKELPLFVTDFLKWIRVCSREEVDQYIEAIKCANKAFHEPPLVIDMRSSYWGRAFILTNPYSNDIWHGMGFFSQAGLRNLRKGDYLVHRKGTFIIIDITRMQDPPDQFFAYVVQVPELSVDSLINVN